MFKNISLISCCFLIISCGAYFNQPVAEQAARTGELTKNTKSLKQLPEPAEPVVAAVYNFKDQTGQYKNVENGSTFSTAISQGATTMLIKALEDSKWFTPIERENLGNLLNERNIIRSTRDEYRKNSNPNEPNLPPLLYAGVLLEGGIISYDTNIITGGAGARYFGAGGSTQYRQDRITVYLRAVSTSSGKVLKTVYVSKTILSQAVDASLFRYVNFQRLLEVETGFTKNEPVQLAMKDAIEKAVESLIIEGIQDNLWSTKEGKEKNEVIVADYLKEKKLEESTGLYEREFYDHKYNNNIDLSFGATILDGDYSKKKLGPIGKLGYTHNFSDVFGLNLNAGVMQFRSGNSYEQVFGNLDLNAQFRILPNDKLTPYVYFGGGIIADFITNGNNLGLNSAKTDGKFQYGGGIEYALSPRIGLKIWAEHNLTLVDLLDEVDQGRRDDWYVNVGFGLNYYFNFGRGKDAPQPAITE